MLQASWIPTPLGDMIVVASTTRIHLLEFVDRKALPTELLALQAALKSPLGLGMTDATVQARAELEAYFAGNKAQFTTPLAPQESSFTRRVHQALCTIPAGETRSYADIARAIGQSSAVRTVARANGANRIALMIPCHRVIGAGGSLTGLRRRFMAQAAADRYRAALSAIGQSAGIKKTALSFDRAALSSP